MAGALRPIVLTTGPIDPAGARLLDPHVTLRVAPDTSSDTLKALVADADGLIVRVTLPPDLIDFAPRLRAIARHGAGLDMVPVAAATARRIPVSYVPGANAVAVAEYCFAAAMALSRRLAQIDRQLRGRDWANARAMSEQAWELNGKTLGVIGLGNIGVRVAMIGNSGFGMNVIATTRRPARAPSGVELVAIVELFQRADMIVLGCPLNDETRGMVDAALLRHARPSCLLINVSRGQVTDELAIADALRTGRIAGAALDVFTTQPLPRDHPLFGLSNVLLTPHLAGLTRESMQRMSTAAAADMLRMLSGQRPSNLANPEVYA